MLGYSRKFMDETYDSIIEFAELKSFEDRPFKQLSSGMKSRLAFSIASLVQPDILILDEVLSVGDGAFRKKSEAKMREIIHGGAATILGLPLPVPGAGDVQQSAVAPQGPPDRLRRYCPHLRPVSGVSGGRADLINGKGRAAGETDMLLLRELGVRRYRVVSGQRLYPRRPVGAGDRHCDLQAAGQRVYRAAGEAGHPVLPAVRQPAPPSDEPRHVPPPAAGAALRCAAHQRVSEPFSILRQAGDAGRCAGPHRPQS